MSTSVLALVVTSGETPYLGATLQALAGQSRPPQGIVVIDVSAHPAPARPGILHLHLPGQANFGAAIWAALHSLELSTLTGPCRLWLLHDDSAPGPTCLAELERKMEQGPSISVVGPKQRAWSRPEQLLEVGIQATVSGARLADIEPEEVDQGQFDEREDVLAVGSAGMLVDLDTFVQLQGFNPHLGPYGDGLEFCRRARLAGGRVVVATRAIIYHRQAAAACERARDGGALEVQGAAALTAETAPAEESVLTAETAAAGPAAPARAFAGASPSSQTAALRPASTASKASLRARRSRQRAAFQARRRAQLFNWALAARAPFTYLVLPWFALIVALGRSLLRVLGRAGEAPGVRRGEHLAPGQVPPGSFGGELLAAAWLVGALPKIVKSRGRIRAVARHSRRSLRPLEVSLWDIYRARRTLRRLAADRARPLPLDDIAAANLRTARALERAVKWAGALLLAVVAALALRGVWGGAAGGNLPGLPTLPGQFFATWWSGWVAAGDGSPGGLGGIDGFALVLSALAWPWRLAGLSDATLMSLMLLVALPAAWLAAWWALTALTFRLPIRFWFALTWALSPALLSSLGWGHLPSVWMAVALPVFAGALARAAGISVDRVVEGTEGNVRVAPSPWRLGQTGLAALALGLMTMIAPVTFIPGLLLVALGARYFKPLRTRAWLIILPGLAWSFPELLRALIGGDIGYWRLLFTQLANPQAFTEAEPWQLLAGLPENPAAWVDSPLLGFLPDSLAQVLVCLPGLVLIALAALAALRLDNRGFAARNAWVYALAGLTGAIIATQSSVSLDGAVPVSGWPGIWLQLAWMSWLVAAALLWIRPGEMLLPISEEYLEELEEDEGGGQWLEVDEHGRPPVQAAFKAARLAAAVAVCFPLAGSLPWFATAWSADPPPAIRVQAADPHSVPALVSRSFTPAASSRTLVLQALPAQADSTLLLAQIWRQPGLSVADLGPLQTVDRYLSVQLAANKDEAGRSLRRAVASLQAGATSGIGQILADHAIGYLIVLDEKNTATTNLINTLQATAGLEQVTTTSTGVVWRLEPQVSSAVQVASLATPAGGTGDTGTTAAGTGTTGTGGGQENGTVSEQLQLWPSALAPHSAPSNGTGSSGQDTGALEIFSLQPDSPGHAQIPAETGAGLLALAERADAGWYASLNGKALEAVDPDTLIISQSEAEAASPSAAAADAVPNTSPENAADNAANNAANNAADNAAGATALPEAGVAGGTPETAASKSTESTESTGTAEVTEPNQWQQVFRLPAGGGEVEWSYAYRPHQIWAALALASLVLAGLATIPWWGRREVR